MDREMLSALLKDADLHIAERRTQLDRFKTMIAELESGGHSAIELREAVNRLEKALALYLEHREELAHALKS